MTKACLILTPNGDTHLHLTTEFGDRYPLSAPRVTIQSQIVHPNIFGSYICTSMLNADEGYTPAHTPKGIVIQLLSFFGSGKIEQINTGANVELARYHNSPLGFSQTDFRCSRRDFGKPVKTNLSEAQPARVVIKNIVLGYKKRLHRNRRGRRSAREQADQRYIGIFQKLIALP